MTECMYVTNTNTVIALDAGSGARLWQFTRPATQGLVGNARSPGNNRSVSVAGDRVFLQTDNAHLIALNRFTGQVLWETEMADYRQNYNATGSMLAIENLVVAGTAGGEQGVRGFLAAYDQTTGKEVWRFWTIPARGEPGSETWDGRDIDHGGGPTWLTGSYDPETRTVYWPTGNAGPDFNGDNRKGDNLYTCSILALDLATGKLKWHYQATPHDEWDWDAVQPLVLVDARWQGQPRKLLLQANRNGFLYVLDRVSGKLLAGKTAGEEAYLGQGDRHGRTPGNESEPDTDHGGTLMCPAVEGATNFFSTSYNPANGLFYVNTLERCNIFTKTAPPEWQAGRGYGGGGGRRAPDERAQKMLRAFDIQTGKVVWEVPQDGPGESWTGTLATASGLVFFGDDGGALSGRRMAARASSCGSLPFTESLHTSPMTYMFDHRQYVWMIVAISCTHLGWGIERRSSAGLKWSRCRQQMNLARRSRQIHLTPKKTGDLLSHRTDPNTRNSPIFLPPFAKNTKTAVAGAFRYRPHDCGYSLWVHVGVDQCMAASALLAMARAPRRVWPLVRYESSLDQSNARDWNDIPTIVPS